jgi:hypothetical protein
MSEVDFKLTVDVYSDVGEWTGRIQLPKSTDESEDARSKYTFVMCADDDQVFISSELRAIADKLDELNGVKE